jgi:hypothetical protein
MPEIISFGIVINLSEDLGLFWLNGLHWAHRLALHRLLHSGHFVRTLRSAIHHLRPGAARIPAELPLSTFPH